MKNYLNQLSIILDNKLFKIDPDGNIFIIGPELILSEFLIIFNDNDPYVQAMNEVISSQVFNSQILHFAFREKSVINIYREERTYYLYQSKSDSKKPIYSLIKTPAFNDYINSINDDIINNLKIKVNEKLRFIKEVVLIYIDSLKKTYRTYSKNTPFYEPTTVTSDEATKQGFIYKEYVHKINKNNKSKDLIAYEIVKYDGNEINLSIPTHIDQVPVLKISEKAFDNTINLVRLWIKNKPHLIIESASFYYCDFLIDIIIDNGDSYHSVKNISDIAFFGSLAGRIHIVENNLSNLIGSVKDGASSSSNNKEVEYFVVDSFENSKSQKLDTVIVSQHPFNFPTYINLRDVLIVSIVFGIGAFLIRLINWNFLNYFFAVIYFLYLLIFIIAFFGVFITQQKFILSKTRKLKNQINLIILLTLFSIMVIYLSNI